jgi:membrane protein DedA with SNARE-associated domain
LINKYSHELSYVFLALIVLLIAYVVIKQAVKRNMKRRVITK